MAKRQGYDVPSMNIFIKKLRQGKYDDSINALIKLTKIKNFLTTSCVVYINKNTPEPILVDSQGHPLSDIASSVQVQLQEFNKKDQSNIYRFGDILMLRTTILDYILYFTKHPGLMLYALERAKGVLAIEDLHKYNNPILNTCITAPLEFAIETQNWDLVQKILNKQHSGNIAHIFKMHSHDLSIFLRASQVNAPKYILQLLYKGAQSIVEQDALMVLICHSNNLDAVQVLVDNKHELLTPFKTDDHSHPCTVLMKSLMLKKDFATRILLSSKSTEHLFLKHYACSVFQYAIDNLNLMPEILELIYDAEPNVIEPGIICRAARVGSIHAVRLLIAKGHNPWTEENGFTPLMYAVRGNSSIHSKIVELLLSLNPTPEHINQLVPKSIVPEQKVPAGAMAYALSNLDEQLVELLLNHGSCFPIIDVCYQEEPVAAALTLINADRDKYPDLLAMISKILYRKLSSAIGDNTVTVIEEVNDNPAAPLSQAVARLAITAESAAHDVLVPAREDPVAVEEDAETHPLTAIAVEIDPPTPTCVLIPDAIKSQIEKLLYVQQTVKKQLCFKNTIDDVILQEFMIKALLDDDPSSYIQTHLPNIITENPTMNLSIIAMAYSLSSEIVGNPQAFILGLINDPKLLGQYFKKQQYISSAHQEEIAPSPEKHDWFIPKIGHVRESEVYLVQSTMKNPLYFYIIPQIFTKYQFLQQCDLTKLRVTTDDSKKNGIKLCDRVVELKLLTGGDVRISGHKIYKYKDGSLLILLDNDTKHQDVFNAHSHKMGMDLILVEDTCEDHTLELAGEVG